METYGVNFEGFEPLCGWPMYKHTEEKWLPQLRAEVERWRKRRDEAAAERAALKSIKVEIEGLAKSRERLVAKLQVKISGGSETKLDEVMTLGVEEAEIETPSPWEKLSSWLLAAKAPIDEIAFYYKYACERADYNFSLYDNCFESSVLDVRFWERTLELQKMYWVFEKAELKYKTKVCRELVKVLVDYIADCREQLGRYDDSEEEKSALREDIEWLYDEAVEDLAYYRQIKADIAAVGVEEAIKHSSRRVSQP